MIFTLGGYELSDRRWNNRLSVNMRGLLKNMILDKSIAVLNNKMRNLLFHIEFLINNWACLIHEGNHAPGRCVKNSLIDKEMNCIIEHDRMLYNGCNRQHLLFSDDQVDEFEFVQSQALHGLAPKCKIINMHELINKSTNDYVTLLPCENGANVNKNR